MTGQSKEDSPDTRDESPTGAAKRPGRSFFLKKSPHDTCLQRISAPWGIIWCHHICQGTSARPRAWLSNSAPVGGGVKGRGGPKGRGGVEGKGGVLRPPPPIPLGPRPK